MSILDDIEIERQIVLADRCGVCQWLVLQEPEVQAAVQQWILDDMPRRNMWKVLQKNGMDKSETTFRAHADHIVLEVNSGNS